MSVLECNRNRCRNIMCDTYISEVGYICNECQSEFKEYLKQKGLRGLTSQQIVKNLKAFIGTEKSQYDNSKDMDIDTFFNEHTQE